MKSTVLLAALAPSATGCYYLPGGRFHDGERWYGLRYCRMGRIRSSLYDIGGLQPGRGRPQCPVFIHARAEFNTIAEQVQSGDWMIIEFGHNDGGSLSTSDNGRTDCSGTGSETCSTVYDGVSETVLTFPAYLENAATAEAAGVSYVDHGAYVANILETLGADIVNGYFPLDHTHTSAEGALVVAQSSFKAVVCGEVALESALNTTTFLGECL
ncbi:CAZyme family CE12 [Penicillium maclennaniae]|uniref:CAZyme family CE12 n=1 Tax=Penicillium maclennaniae TaxID=1343394 RepID=UPI00254105B0|nr:CAZyme family CE12 [Penicillium maclennaniae]KAJ5668619.1 CAZyme family CE12 [Penicillium maclennaniae]